MKANLEHYLLHWEFFKSTNPKSDELFFVKYALSEIKKSLRKLKTEIDFSNDGNSTMEEFLNNEARKTFFFKKEYKDFLKQRLKEVKAKQKLRKLPSFENSVIIHYGCSDFKSDEHKIFWIGAIHFNPSKSYFFENKDEITTIERLKEFIDNNNDKTFIHWSMNSFKFGFKAIEDRYYQLTKKSIDLMPYKELDLSEYLKNKYGIYYVPRENGRLNNLAKLNGFSGIQSDIEVININDAGNRLELIFSIVQADKQNLLKTKNENHLLEQKQEKVKNTIITFKFKNNFDDINEDEVYKYFHDNLVGKKWLKKNELEKYLKSAFENKTIPEKLFKIKNKPTNQRVYKVFYNYYKEVAQKPHGKSTQYVELLGNYFQGYKTSVIKTNWSK